MLSQKERGTTETERQYRLDEALRFPLTNEYIWMSMIGDVEERGRGKLLRFDDCVRIVETCAHTHQGENISAAVIAQETGIGDFSKSRFLNRVSFNFSCLPGVEERWELAQKALMDPTIIELQNEDTKGWLMCTVHQFLGGSRSIDYGGNIDFMRPDRYFKDVEMRHFDYWNIRSGKSFNRASQQEEIVFQLTGHRPTRAENLAALGFSTIPLPAGIYFAATSFGAVEMAAALISPFAGWFVAAYITNRTGGWEHLELFTRHYEEKVFPLLAENELVKASNYRLFNDRPTIVRSSI